MVFLQHYRQQPWGFTGVNVFFVLSGFLITGILWDSRNVPGRIRTFYVRRTLRIFPLYYGIMVAILMTQPIFHWAWNWKWLVWPAYVGNLARFFAPYSSNSPTEWLADFKVHGMFGDHHVALYLGHFWSLCIEEQFYLIWPWFVFFVRSRRVLLWICGSSVVVCLGLRLLGASMLPRWMLQNEALYRITPFQLDALLFGGFLALLLRGPSSEVLLRAARLAAPIALILFIAWTVLSPYGAIWRVLGYEYPPWMFTWGLSAVDLLSGLVILMAIQPKSFLSRGLSLPPLRWLGRISYGAYVLHDIPHAYYGSLGKLLSRTETRFTTIFALIGTMILAQLSFWLFESPFLNLKERLAPAHSEVTKGVVVKGRALL